MKTPLAVFLTALLLPGPLDAQETGVEYFRDVKPLIGRRCVACHGALKQKGGLRLDTAARMRTGGDGGPAVVAGKSPESLLIEAVTGIDDWRMPPEGEGESLSADEIARLKAWIDAGAQAPDESEPDDPRRHWAFQPPVRPEVPSVKDAAWVRNPIDAFLVAEHEARGLRPRPDADKGTLLRRIYLDLIGLSPSPEERLTFLADPSQDAYEKVVNRLLDSPQYGERWGRHWMDVWRYSDWDGYQKEVRESKPHIWRWRDWIVESLNVDKGYDRMIVEMLAADEAEPGDPATLRATGFLVRNWYKFNRNSWLDNTVEHTAKAFLGMTFNCARCHDHKYDPIEHADYYRLRAFFEPHQIRTDRVPGEADAEKDGVVRVFDADAGTKTYLFARGDESQPAKESPLTPGLPKALFKDSITIRPVRLPWSSTYPGLGRVVREETLGKAREELGKAEARLAKARVDAAAGPPGDPKMALVTVAESVVAASRAEWESLLARIAADTARYASPPETGDDALARKAGAAERRAAVVKADEARLGAQMALDDAQQKLKPGDGASIMAVLTAEKARDAARKGLEAAREGLAQESPKYLPIGPVYPETSTGRRLALAQWLTRRDNPLTARVAVNHIWLRHFGTPIVETVSDFGLNGRAPSHRALLDWLAVELMEGGWSMKALHRRIVTTHAYQMQSSGEGPEDPNLAIDPANTFLWRMNPRRMEAELVRDNLLRVAGGLDMTLGGPDLDPGLDQISRRRSLYFRHAKEKKATFLTLFDSANPTACYRRAESVVPQQALAMANSPLTFEQSRLLAAELSTRVGSDPGAASDQAFVGAAFERILSRPPTAEESDECRRYIVAQAARFADTTKLTPFTSGPASQVKPATNPRLRARENLVHVLFNHNDFVTIR